MMTIATIIGCIIGYLLVTAIIHGLLESVLINTLEFDEEDDVSIWIRILSFVPVVNVFLAGLMISLCALGIVLLIIAVPFMAIMSEVEKLQEKRKKKKESMTMGEKRKLKIKKLV